MDTGITEHVCVPIVITERHEGQSGNLGPERLLGTDFFAQANRIPEVDIH
jgi:hypothetical protein